MGSITFYAKQINHGQSDIWLGDDGKELAPKRRLATNEVVNVTPRLCSTEFNLAIVRPEDRVMIGGVGFGLTDWHEGTANVGYVLPRSALGLQLCDRSR